MASQEYEVKGQAGVSWHSLAHWHHPYIDKLSPGLHATSAQTGPFVS